MLCALLIDPWAKTSSCRAPSSNMAPLLALCIKFRRRAAAARPVSCSARPPLCNYANDQKLAAGTYAQIGWVFPWKVWACDVCSIKWRARQCVSLLLVSSRGSAPSFLPNWFGECSHNVMSRNCSTRYWSTLGLFDIIFCPLPPIKFLIACYSFGNLFCPMFNSKRCGIS